jgi:hypothetical protein
MLLSFERPASAGGGAVAQRARPHEPSAGRRIRLSTVLENCTEATSAAIDKRRLNNGYHRTDGARIPAKGCDRNRSDHRQDSKGAWWMPWHQESMKGVNGCDKPRLGAEWPLTRGFPNGETQRW